MKNKVPLLIIMAHLCLCLFLSFDWGFLEGEYFGYDVTFLMVYGLTLPLVISTIAVSITVYQAIRKNS